MPGNIYVVPWFVWLSVQVSTKRNRGLNQADGSGKQGFGDTGVTIAVSEKMKQFGDKMRSVTRINLLGMDNGSTVNMLDKKLRKSMRRKSGGERVKRSESGSSGKASASRQSSGEAIAPPTAFRVSRASGEWRRETARDLETVYSKRELQELDVILECNGDLAEFKAAMTKALADGEASLRQDNSKQAPRRQSSVASGTGGGAFTRAFRNREKLSKEIEAPDVDADPLAPLMGISRLIYR